MAKQKISINDFGLLLSSLKALNKIADSAKFSINSTGLTIYGKNAYSRCELTTDAIISEKDPIEFCILELSMFIKVLGTAAEIHESDAEDISLTFDYPFVKIESGKFKTKLNTCKEEIIVNSVSQKVKTALTPVFEFTTSTKQIKYVNSHSFIVNDTDMARVYLSTEKDMENNVVYARIGNDSNELNNSITLKLGLVNFGSIDGRKIIVNFDRLNAFSIVDSDSIAVQLMDKNVLVNTVLLSGKNDTKCKIMIYTSILAN